MNNKIKSLLGGAVVTRSMFVAPMTSMADDAIVTGNAGILSDYITTELGGFEVTGAIVHTMDLNDGSVDGDDEETEAYVSISWGFDVI